MARAYGANALLLAAFETAYGVPPATGFVKFPFVSSSLGSEQGLIDSDILGQGRDPAAPSRDVIKVEGDVVAPVDLRYFGHWLKALLGPPASTGTGPYDHVYGSGAMSLPSLVIEIGMPEVPVFFLIGGVRLNSLQMNFQRSGHANATFNAIGQARKLVADLERQLLGASDPRQAFIDQALSRLPEGAPEKQRAEVERLAGALYGQKQAIEELNQEL
ncbi:MAG: phage tail tube protein [Rhodospirillales bacterium]|nr:phage tail tube protein [Rhodospirillales bacterium]